MFSYFNNIHNYLYFFSEIKYRIFYIMISLIITFIISYIYKEQLIYLLTHDTAISRQMLLLVREFLYSVKSKAITVVREFIPLLTPSLIRN